MRRCLGKTGVARRKCLPISYFCLSRFLDLGRFLLLGAQDLFVFVFLRFLISGSQEHKDEETRGNQGRLFWAPRISIVFMWAANCKSEIAVKHSSITKECGNGMR